MSYHKFWGWIALAMVILVLNFNAPRLYAQPDPDEMDPVLRFLGFDYFEYHGFAEARA